ncbi:MAG: urea ABC transporter permease subunit UrtB [Alphaproteobacteria bacterium]|nr:urea ABC transporter permease subunit UrtB [Alphaproteobacteria bacterium]
MRLLLATLLGWLVLAAGTAHADPLADAAAKLPEGGYSERVARIEAIAAIGDPRAIPLLEALGEGDLHVRESDGRVVIAKRAGRDYALTDPLTGESLGTAGRRDTDKIRVNNRVRGTIAEALTLLKLASPDAATRRAAADDAAKYGSPLMLERLRAALATETDAGVKTAMQSALLTAELAAGTPEERIAAIEGLSGSLDPAVRALLGQVQNDANAPENVRDAATKAIAKIESQRAWLDAALAVFQGVSLGSILLLAAIGLAITFGVMGVINMAHGEMMMLGAYSTFVVQQAFRTFLPPSVFDLYLIAAIPVAFLVAAIAGMAMERSVIRFLYNRPLETLLATWGISLILQQAVRSVFGATNQEVANPNWMSGGVEIIGGVVLTYNRLCIIAFCLIVLGLVVLVLRKTHFGLEMRAVTQNRRMARSMGIDSSRVDALTFGLGSGVAGIAGVALSQVGNVSPNLGQLYIVDSFMVVVFGGVGNLAGTFVAAMSLGILNKFLEPVAGAVLGKVVVLVLVILFIQRRPRGLFALKGRAEEA